MTVAELVQELQNCDPDQEIRFAYPSGDYWRTTILSEIRRVEQAPGEPSRYHGPEAIRLVDEEELEPGDVPTYYVVLD